ncbi:bifunctional phosphoribosylaminoimidazolecarboxamide formyltransferase/IMP cyclohydrolase [Thermospira aquatica]|uniref:Bifunctional purine biosynthesis protein PurH n=1 Tax=Thermospira aquatica TaxID=2828656 RepID=A0AAX3BCD6_9SPIR|nr:bifunctional phosphoribosylaminoimidazolecarboxamide formyltransferase/IMP cyclohydrolase [Thermospira aquatica]URA09988.1 bifunctional phosphoribosylaminoimidazolecarboxamide formyltransferase/IMP cyclohydrolase [Thermospira aquatica]
MNRALFSLYHKEGCESFARFLVDRGYEILSTGGTYKYLQERGIPVSEVSQVTGFPEVFDGRVKTLHPMIHGGILFRRENSSHQQQLTSHKIVPIDFVVVNLYPFKETIQKPNVTLEEIIEQIDIGGVALIRAAAKNYHDVCIIVDNNDIPLIQEEIEKNGSVSLETRTRLATKAFSHTAYYDSMISTYFQRMTEMTFPMEMGLPLKKISSLRYGENPHQQAALYRSFVDANISTINAEILWGKEMSYNNYLDADGCLDILREFANDKPFAVIIKHTNPCGAAYGQTLQEAFKRAKASDPVSAFGGIIGVNQTMDKSTATSIIEDFFEIVIAPEYDPEALDILKTKKNLRILKLKGSEWMKKGLNYRRIEGGMLVQEWDQVGMSQETWKVVTRTSPTDEQNEDLKFAWKIAKHVKSNAIVYVKAGQVIGVGAGQMSRVDSARIALEKTTNVGLHIQGAVMASDAFFPFRDTVDTAAKDGIVAIVQPGGSMRDQESIDAANEHGIAMVFTGIRHFKH